MMPCLWCDESEDDDDIFMPSSKGKSAASSKGKSVAPPSIDSDDDFMPSSKGCRSWLTPRTVPVDARLRTFIS